MRSALTAYANGPRPMTPTLERAMGLAVGDGVRVNAGGLTITALPNCLQAMVRAARRLREDRRTKIDASSPRSWTAC